MSNRIKITPKQGLFLRSNTRGTIFRAGLGSGKSLILCYKAIINALKGRRQLIVSFSYVMLRDVLMFTFKQVLPLFGLRESIDYTLYEKMVLVRGTEILLRSGDDPDSLRGPNVHDFFIDEARNFKTNEIFLILLGRIRESEDASWGICTTPRGKDWVHELSQTEGVTLIVQKTTENTFLPKSYIADLRLRYPTKFLAQELDAEIVEMGAGVIDPSWFKYVDRVEYKDAVRAWDLAVSIKTQADFTAGAWCSMVDSKLYIRHMVHGKFEYPDLKKKIITTAQMDGTDTIISLEQAGQQLGYIDDLKKNTPELLPYTIKSRVPEGDKLNRALPWITRAEAGNVFLVRGPWNAKFTEECRDFSADMSHLHDDQIDAVSQAYGLLCKHSVVRADRVRY
jgi:predicted phage terminase large subunit-like protein